jgi:hypothetical protein
MVTVNLIVATNFVIVTGYCGERYKIYVGLLKIKPIILNSHLK